MTCANKFSVDDVASERSDAVVILVMEDLALTARMPVLSLASFSEYVFISRCDSVLTLQVASQETLMKNDAFAYNLEASRQYQSRGTTVVPPLATVGHYQDALPMPASEPVVYRQPSASFAYSKPYYPMSGWPHGLPDEPPVPYGVYGPSYHSIQDQEYSMAYRIGPSVPTKTSSPLYVDTEPSYTYSSGPPTSLIHRSPAGTDSPFAYQNVATGLISSVGSSDRVLPTPNGRTLPSSGPSSYRHDSTASTYSKGSQSSTSGASPTTPNSDVPSGYTNYEPSSLSSYPPTTLASQLSRSNGLYPTTGSVDGIYSESLRTTGSAPELQYRYTDTTTRKDSTSAALTLSHTSTYVPQGHGHSNVSYMLSGDVGSGAAETASETHRNGAGALRT